MNTVDFRTENNFFYIPTRMLLAGFFALALTCNIQAAGLGKLTVGSYLGQPFKAEVALESVKSEEIDSLVAKLASPEAFQKAGIKPSPYHATVSVSVEKRVNGQPYIKITSPQSANEPFLNLLIELGGPAGNSLREYTILLDPAESDRAVSAAPVTQAAENTAENGSSAASEQAVHPVTRAENRQPVSRSNSTHSGNTYGPITRGDTLSRIARQMAPEGVELNRMLVALFRANRDAFIQNNMNLLRTGVTLRVPDQDAIAAITSRDAVREVVAQTESWNNYRQRLADTAVAVSGESRLRQSQTGKVSVVTDDTAVAGQTQPEEVLTLSKGELLRDDQSSPEDADSSTAQQYLRMMEEDAIAKERALQEANERVAQLEQNISRLQRLLELKEPLSEAVTADGVLPESTLDQNETAVLAETASNEDSSESASVDAVNAGQAEMTIPAQPITAGIASLPSSPIQTPESQSDSAESPWLESLTSLTDFASENIEWTGGALAALLTVGLGISVLRRKKQPEEDFLGTDFEVDDDTQKEGEQVAALASEFFTSGPETAGENNLELADEDTVSQIEFPESDIVAEQDGDEITSPGFFFGKELGEASSEDLSTEHDFIGHSQAEEDVLTDTHLNEVPGADDEILFHETDSAQEEASQETTILSETDEQLTDSDLLTPSGQDEHEQWIFPGRTETTEEASDILGEENVVQEKDTTADDVEIKFDLTLPEETDISEPAPAETKIAEISASLADIDLDLGDTLEDSSAPEINREALVEDPEMQQREVATKLDLAKAYLEMDDKEGARDILEEVLLEGDAEQQSAARALMDEIG